MTKNNGRKPIEKIEAGITVENPIDLREQAKEEHEHEETILDSLVRKGVYKVLKGKDVHSYHSPKMLRCLTYLRADGASEEKAHRVCAASIGEEANTKPNPEIDTEVDYKRATQAAFKKDFREQIGTILGK